MGKLGSAARAQESEMSQKPQVWAKRWSLTTHQPALLCSTQVQKNSVCSFPHRTGCSSLFNLLLPFPWFFAAPFHQHYPNSPNPGLSICGISEQLRRAETLGTCYSSVLRSPCTRTPEFLMKDGELSFSQHRSRWTSLTQALKSWLLSFSTFFFFIFFFSTEVILSSWQLIHAWIFTEAFILFLTQSRSRNAALWFALLCWNKPICLQQGLHIVTTSDLKSDEN